MLKTPAELSEEIGARVKARRLAMEMSQAEAARRSGVSYRTWRRLEAEAKASIDDLVKAAVALRCEEGLETLFPAPKATSLDALLQQTTQRARKPRRAVRAGKRSGA